MISRRLASEDLRRAGGRARETARPKDRDKWTAREYALLCAGAGAGVLAVLPAVLTLVGTGWPPGRHPRGDATRPRSGGRARDTR